jgi:hypothetical protein
MDLDRRGERAHGLRAELRERPPALRVVLVLPDPESEAWMVAMFEPKGDAGHEALDALRRELGFDPTAEPHRLTSTVHGSPKDAKRVCAKLLSDAWRDRISPRPFARITRVGQACGLASFVDEIDAQVIPLLGGPA